MAPICTLVARLTEVEVKTINHMVTTIEMAALVETLSNLIIKMKSRRRSRKRKREKKEALFDALTLKIA